MPLLKAMGVSGMTKLHALHYQDDSDNRGLAYLFSNGTNYYAVFQWNDEVKVIINKTCKVFSIPDVRCYWSGKICPASLVSMNTFQLNMHLCEIETSKGYLNLPSLILWAKGNSKRSFCEGTPGTVWGCASSRNMESGEHRYNMNEWVAYSINPILTEPDWISSFLKRVLSLGLRHFL